MSESRYESVVGRRQIASQSAVAMACRAKYGIAKD